MAFAARAAGQGASLLSSPPCAPIAEIVLRHGPVERNALAHPSSSDRPEGGRRLLQPRRPALALAEYPKRIAKTGLSRGPETEAARAGRADYGRLLPLQIRHMDCGCAVSMA
jgi:hypothetical protein